MQNQLSYTMIFTQIFYSKYKIMIVNAEDLNISQCDFDLLGHLNEPSRATYVLQLPQSIRDQLMFCLPAVKNLKNAKNIPLETIVDLISKSYKMTAITDLILKNCVSAEELLELSPYEILQLNDFYDKAVVFMQKKSGSLKDFFELMRSLQYFIARHTAIPLDSLFQLYITSSLGSRDFAQLCSQYIDDQTFMLNLSNRPLQPAELNVESAFTYGEFYCPSTTRFYFDSTSWRVFQELVQVCSITPKALLLQNAQMQDQVLSPQSLNTISALIKKFGFYSLQLFILLIDDQYISNFFSPFILNNDGSLDYERINQWALPDIKRFYEHQLAFLSIFPQGFGLTSMSCLALSIEFQEIRKLRALTRILYQAMYARGKKSNFDQIPKEVIMNIISFFFPQKEHLELCSFYFQRPVPGIALFQSNENQNLKDRAIAATGAAENCDVDCVPNFYDSHPIINNH